MSGVDKQFALQLYERMLEIREFEDRVYELFLHNLIHGTTHLCQGQEAVAVGACSALLPGDVVTCSYRGHGQALALGCNPGRMMAELMGRRDGLSYGRGGSMHLHDFERGLLGTFSVVGAQLSVAAGAAYAFQVQGRRNVALSFFGDGAANIGTFHETLNLAAVWKLPVVFVCENNLYGEYSPVHLTTAVRNISERAPAYAMPGRIVDGQDVLAVHEAVRQALERARDGGGPSLIEAKTYRYKGHSRADPAKYRPPGELEEWLARDPIALEHRRLTQEGILTEASDERIRAQVRERIDAAVDFAMSSPDPEPDSLASHVYSAERK